jgi:endonuclease YncB( thermonuclease family)
MAKYRNNWDAQRRRHERKRQPPIVALFAIVFVGTIALAQGYLSGWFEPATAKVSQFVALAGAGVSITANAETEPSGERISFLFCHNGGGTNCVVDGDTIWLHGEKIRIADYDTPETHEPQCASERQLGDRATRRLHQLLESGTITVEPIDRDQDQYGRKLRIVKVEGRSVGDTLVGEGLARWYEGGRQPWC